ncbi:ribulokinase, partial [Thioclava sp. BHET1]
MTYFIGIDVGTGSARAGVFDASGAMVGSGKQDIRLWRDGHDRAEQSSGDIWSAVCGATRAAMDEAAIAAEAVT